MTNNKNQKSSKRTDKHDSTVSVLTQQVSGDNNKSKCCSRKQSTLSLTCDHMSVCGIEKCSPCVRADLHWWMISSKACLCTRSLSFSCSITCLFHAHSPRRSAITTWRTHIHAHMHTQIGIYTWCR